MHTNEPNTYESQPALQRRAFLAAGAAAIPALALATLPATASAALDEDSDFDKGMHQASDALKAMRRLMRDLSSRDSQLEAAMHANAATQGLAKCVEFADQAPVPARSESKYDGDKARFNTDLQIKLTSAVSAANALSRALLMGNTEEATALYDALRTERKEGHNEFEEED